VYTSLNRRFVLATDKSKSMLVGGRKKAQLSTSFDDEEEAANGARTEPTGSGLARVKCTEHGMMNQNIKKGKLLLAR
jgi:hypothetical protein